MINFSSLRYIFRAVGGFTILCDAVAVAAVVTALASPNSGWAAALLAVSTLLVLGLTASLLVSVRREKGAVPQLIGTASTARILLVLAALDIDLADGATWWAVAAGALICLMIVAESAIRRPVRAAVPQSANIPGWDVPLPSQALANLLFAVDTLGMVLVVASGFLDVTQVPATLAAVVAIVLAVVITAQAARYLIRRNRFEKQLPKILKAMKPSFAFHWQAPAGTAYQAAMWLPYLDRIGVPYFVLVRTPANFAEVTKLTSAPVILRVRLEDLDRILCPSLKAVFYANTAVRNSHMIRFPQLTHIQLNHGDSDKIASVSPTFRQYDKNFVAGQAAIDRFAKHGVATRADQFEMVSRPQLENVARAVGPIGSVAHPTVLYSPTWSGFYEDSDYSSLPAGPAIVEAMLARGCTVIFRPHPYARRHKGNADACDRIIALLEADAKDTGREHVFGALAEETMTVADCFNASDAMVSDVSSVVSDFLSSGKPFAMAAVSAHGEAFVEEFPMAAAAYVFDVQDGDAVGIGALLEDMLGADPKAPVRAAMRDYYLTDTPTDQIVDRFVRIARKYVA